jgi:5-methylcytosine-specific restriction endonuclease McrA
LIVFFKKNFVNVEIYRKEFKFYKNIVVVGLKYSGKKIKRRVKGFARQYIQKNNEAKCIYCEKELSEQNSTTDHIIPISKRGNNSQVNLVVTCKDCNNERGNLEFKKYLKIKNPKLGSQKHPFV